MKKIFYLDEAVVRQQLIYGISRENMCKWWDVPRKFLDDFIERKNLEKLTNQEFKIPDEESKVCSNCGVKKHMLKYEKGHNQCYLCRRRKKNNRHYKMVREILEESGRKYACEECGYDENVSAIQFHHRDEKEKSTSISELKKRNSSKEKITKELVKCDVLCATCHAAVHNPHLRSTTVFSEED